MTLHDFGDPDNHTARALEVVGERWSLLIFRSALFNGITRFSDFERTVGLAPNILATRLSGFVDSGLMELHQYSEHPERHEYLLTEKARDLAPIIIALALWADHWATRPGETSVFVHMNCGGTIGQEFRCGTCGEVLWPSDTSSSDPAADLMASMQLSEPFTATGTHQRHSTIEISLLGTFDVRIAGRKLDALSVGSQRLLAFLALHNRSVTRVAMAGTMWPEASDHSAGISLRSALSRLDQPTRDAVLLATAGLRLADTVAVDLREAQALAHRLLHPDGSPSDLDLRPEAVHMLSLELLPDWYDDWVVNDAADWRQLRMNALEALSGYLIDRNRLAEAAGAARAAIRGDSLRESSHACLIRIHLAEGNQSEALRVFELYRALLFRELGLQPTPHLTELVAGIQKN